MALIPPSVERRTLTAPGLERPAEIIVDDWGVAHIYAATIDDAFFAQGFNAARERLWQIDLWRKRGLGLLARSFGPDYVDQDRAARLFLYRGDIDAEWAAYGSRAKARTQAFVAGINAYVARVRAGAAPLPPEFDLTQSSPELWKGEDVVRIRSQDGLARNAESEVARAQVIARGGVEADRLRRKLEPPHVLETPAGLDPAEVPTDVLADYVLGTKEVVFKRREAAAEVVALPHADSQGSNNWALAPSRTATGRPILANDPHRALVAPSVRYIVHLDAPGLTIIGAGEPQTPGITIGHNGRIAFGITTFMVDQEDLYVYELNPDDPRQYRYGGGWEPTRIVRETVEVKDGATREVELAFTRHGPVLKADTAMGRAFALRSVWSDPGTGPYFGSAQYLQAGNWEEFTDALSHWGAASMNFVYADTQGNVGWIPAGMIPKRPNWDGLTPVPGDGRYEWQGYLSQGELPSLYNPAKGWVASANEMNLPAGYPSDERMVGFEWADPSRAMRIEEVFAANDRVSIADSLALQTDDVSVRARRAAALLRGLTSPDPALAQALALLAAWDGAETRDSAGAAIAEVWLNKHLGPATARRVTPAAADLLGPGAPYAVVSYLESPDGALPIGAREQILLSSLKAALDEIAGRLGPDMADWRWGALHHIHLVPAAAGAADPVTRAAMSHGPVALPGSASTTCAATYRMEDFAVVTGASFRMVLDVGAWDNSRVINSPGQSGDPASPHYNDLFPLWAEGGYVPLLFTRDAIERAARLVITLAPAD